MPSGGAAFRRVATSNKSGATFAKGARSNSRAGSAPLGGLPQASAASLAPLEGRGGVTAHDIRDARKCGGRLCRAPGARPREGPRGRDSDAARKRGGEPHGGGADSEPPKARAGYLAQSLLPCCARRHSKPPLGVWGRLASGFCFSSYT